MAKLIVRRRYKEYPASITIKGVSESLDKSINRYMSALNVLEGKELLKGEACLAALEVGLLAEFKRLNVDVNSRKIGDNIKNHANS